MTYLCKYFSTHKNRTHVYNSVLKSIKDDLNWDEVSKKLSLNQDQRVAFASKLDKVVYDKESKPALYLLLKLESLLTNYEVQYKIPHSDITVEHLLPQVIQLLNALTCRIQIKKSGQNGSQIKWSNSLTCLVILLY